MKLISMIKRKEYILMKRCKACGSQIADTANNCPKCGSADLEVMAAPQPAPFNGVQPMMGGYPQAQPQMGMTYAVVYMVILGLVLMGNAKNLFSDFYIGDLIAAVFLAATIILLAMRNKVGRILAMIQSVIVILEGVLFGILAIIGGAAIEELAGEILAVDGLGAALGAVFGIAAAISIAFGTCSFIYFKKRACMYTK